MRWPTGGQPTLQLLKAPFYSAAKGPDLQTLLAGRQSQGNMGLGGAAWGQGDDAFAAVDEGPTGKLHGQDLVQRRNGPETEVVQALGPGNFAALIRRFRVNLSVC